MLCIAVLLSAVFWVSIWTGTSRTDMQLCGKSAAPRRCEPTGRRRAPPDDRLREKFNTYRFAGHREKVIDLLTRMTRVSVRTQEIVGEMRKASPLAKEKE